MPCQCQLQPTTSQVPQLENPIYTTSGKSVHYSDQKQCSALIVVETAVYLKVGQNINLLSIDLVNEFV